MVKLLLPGLYALTDEYLDLPGPALSSLTVKEIEPPWRAAFFPSPTRIGSGAPPYASAREPCYSEDSLSNSRRAARASSSRRSAGSRASDSIRMSARTPNARVSDLVGKWKRWDGPI